ncbi:Uncharacterised protein [Mycobacteroides abscessus subsp. abscessus]|nr:Uncharacterised protein [Mycobacteroides abscessus subsp. abscessus]
MVSASRTPAMPKSVSSTRSGWPMGALASRMLAGLTSRCSTPLACAKSSAAATSPMICTARPGASTSMSAAAASEPGTNCMEIHSCSSSAPRS